MKKRFLLTALITALLVCTFAFVVSAESSVPEVTETVYLAASKDSETAQALINEGKTVVTYDELISSTKSDAANGVSFFDKYKEGDHVEVIFVEDIFVSKTLVPTDTGILIRKPITVTFKYNGFSHYIDCGGSTNYNGIVLRNSGALLRLIGTKAKDANGEFSKEYTIPTGDVADGNYKTTGCYTDVHKYANSYVDVLGGKVYCENLRGWGSKAVIRGMNGTNSLFEFKNCALFADNGYAVDDMTQSATVIKIDGGYYQGVEIYSPANGSLIENAVLEGCGIEFDSWHSSPHIWTIKNTSINKIYTKSGRTHLVLIDCEFDPETFALYGDGWGDQFIRAYTSPTCDKDGTITLYRSTGKGTANIYEDEINNYSAPALGHLISLESAMGVTWDNYFENGLYYGICERCALEGSEKTGSADPLFVNMGLSYSEFEDDTNQMAQGFKINSHMKKFLQEGFDFGVIATVNKSGTEYAPSLNGEGVVSASFTNLGFEIFYIKMTNIPNEYKNTAVVFCAYLVNGENTYYLNNGKTSKTVVGLSYNDVSSK